MADLSAVGQLKAEIQEKKVELVKLLQVYCRSQVALWHQVPALAKEMDRLNHFSVGRYKMAHHCYFWPISHQFLNGLRVDLRTGAIQSGGELNSALNAIELGQIPEVLDQLDAMEVIKFLEDGIKTLSFSKQKLGEARDS